MLSFFVRHDAISVFPEKYFITVVIRLIMAMEN